MTTRTTHRDAGGSAASSGTRITLRVGTASSAVLATAALLDLTLVGSLARNLAAIYTPYGVQWRAVHTVLAVVVLAVGLLGVLGWEVFARSAAVRRRWAAAAGTTLFVLGLAVALPLAGAQEYGQTLVPTWLGALVLLPSVVGVVATVQLWRSRAAGDRGDSPT